MGRPRLIILIRHAQSEGNKNRDIHQTVPDHRVKLTQEGWEQAYEAGRRLRAMLRPEDTLHFFTSPYRRTRETTEGILATLTSDEEEPSPFKRNNIKVYEEPRLREQDFGNFQPCSAEMERMWQERADYGHFFYRIPNGESAADAYDRISGFNESLWRQFGEDDFSSVCVLVTHGLMSRVFLMKWYHFSVEYFEDLRNINHCEFLIMTRQDSGKYVLENKLRTWSELRREKAVLAGKEEVEGKSNGANKDGLKLKKASSSSLLASSPVPTRRRWGGCPNGCNHDKNFKIRTGLADLVTTDHKAAASSNTVAPSLGGTLDCSDRAASPVQPNPSFNGNGNATPTLASRRPASKRFATQHADAETPEEAGPRIDVDKARDNVVSSPDGTPSFISVEDRLRSHIISPRVEHHQHGHYADRLLHKGRDGGGTYSGHNSVAASDADSSEDERHRHRRTAATSRHKTVTTLADDSHDSLHDADDEKNEASMHRGSLLRPKANRLGDVPHSSDGEHDHDGDEEADDEPELEETEPDHDLTPQENHEQSVQGSVF